MSDILAEKIPKSAVAGAGAVVLLSIALAAVARYGDIGRVAPQPAPAAETVALRFEDRAGAVVVKSGADGREIAVLAPGTNGFVRGVLRGLARERRKTGTGAEPPFQLVRRVDGRLSLVDPETGREIQLDAFGPTNVEAFARLLTQTGERKS